MSESEVLADAERKADELMRSTSEYCDQLKYSVNQKLDAQLYDCAMRLNDSMELIEDVRAEIRKRNGGKN